MNQPIDPIGKAVLANLGVLQTKPEDKAQHENIVNKNVGLMHGKDATTTQLQNILVAEVEENGTHRQDCSAPSNEPMMLFNPGHASVVVNRDRSPSQEVDLIDQDIGPVVSEEIPPVAGIDLGKPILDANE